MHATWSCGWKDSARRVKLHFRQVVIQLVLFCWTDWRDGTVEVGWCNRRLLVKTSKSTATEHHLSHVGREVGQQISLVALSVLITGNISCAAAPISIRECKTKIDRIWESRIDQIQVYGVSIKQHGSWCGRGKQPCEWALQLSDNLDLGWKYIRFAYNREELYIRAFVVIPPVMRKCVMSNCGQRVQVSILVVQGLSQKQRQLMPIVLWISTVARTRVALSREACNGIVTNQAQWTDSRSKNEEHNQRGVQTKSASRGQHVRIVVLSTDTDGIFWTKKIQRWGQRVWLWRVERQMHQKTVKCYWVNIVKLQVAGAGVPTLKDTLIQQTEAALTSDST